MRRPKGISSLEDRMLAADGDVPVSDVCTVALLEHREFLRGELENCFFGADLEARKAPIAAYRDVMERIQRDDAFLEYIAGVVPSLEQELGRIADEDRDE